MKVEDDQIAKEKKGGTTFQWWLSRAVALQGSVPGGIGYAAAGNVTQVGERDYRYGVAPQGLLALRLILGDMAMLRKSHEK